MYLPGLNGLRAIAALAVVISHITLALDSFGLNSKIFGTDKEGKAQGWDLAGNGVTIFFVLSGFLITYLLLKEKESGSIKIKDFYARRALRIWPLYYLYFILFLVTAAVFGIQYNHHYSPFYILLMANVPFIINQALPMMAHYWSLGVEEQFYLFFPHLAKISNRKLLRVSLILITCFLFAKMASWFLLKKFGIGLPLTILTVNRFHIMLIGVAGAILYYNQSKKFIAITTHVFTQAVCWLCLLLIACNKFHLSSLLDAELVAIVAMCLIMGQVAGKTKLVNLENKICNFIGRISYGMYIIHPLLIFLFGKMISGILPNDFLSYLYTYITILGATIVLSYISYEFFEKKFLALKLRFTTVKSTNDGSEMLAVG